MADPQVIQCAAACTVTVVHSLPLLEMTVEEGAQIAGAVLAVWAAGWAFADSSELKKGGCCAVFVQQPPFGWEIYHFDTPEHLRTLRRTI